jgi:hypothetical protein
MAIPAASRALVWATRRVLAAAFDMVTSGSFMPSPDAAEAAGRGRRGKIHRAKVGSSTLHTSLQSKTIQPGTAKGQKSRQILFLCRAVRGPTQKEAGKTILPARCSGKEGG